MVFYYRTLGDEEHAANVTTSNVGRRVCRIGHTGKDRYTPKKFYKNIPKEFYEVYFTTQYWLSCNDAIYPNPQFSRLR